MLSITKMTRVVFAGLVFCSYLFPPNAGQAQMVGGIPSSTTAEALLLQRLAPIVELLERTNHEIDLAEKEIDKREALLDQLAQAWPQDFYVTELSYPQIVTQLQVQRINLSVEMAGLQAKIMALGKLAEQPQEVTVAENAGAKEQKIAELREMEQRDLQRLEALLKNGVTTQESLNEVRRNIINLELQLLDVRQPQRPTVSPWIQETTEKLALDRIEIEAKFAKVEELLTPLQGLRPQMTAIQKHREELGAWRQERANLKVRQVDLQMRELDLKTNPPQIGSDK